MSKSNPEAQGLYGDRARYYDAIYHFKPYGKEAERIHELLRTAGVADGARILEAACGTGTYLTHLIAWYDVAGFDLYPQILEIARAKLPNIHLFEGDMVNFEVEEPFDAILCLFSSIGYVWTATFPVIGESGPSVITAASSPDSRSYVQP